ncbi:MAG: flagellar hook-length control protein FliK [Clostridia bacterium]|nr:flagellar hook-length control protein FliK [Clostridia bacterium]
MQDNLILVSPKPVEPVMGSKVPVAVGKGQGFGTALAKAMVKPESEAATDSGNLPGGLGQLITGNAEKGSEPAKNLQLGSGIGLGNHLVTQTPVEVKDVATELNESLEGLLELLILLQQAISGTEQQKQAAVQELGQQPAEGNQGGLNLKIVELLNKLTQQGEEVIQLLAGVSNLNPQQEQLVGQLRQIFLPEKPTAPEREEGLLKQLLIDLKELLTSSTQGQEKKPQDLVQLAGKVEELVKTLGGLVQGFSAFERVVREQSSAPVKGVKTATGNQDGLSAPQQEQPAKIVVEETGEKETVQAKQGHNQQQGETENVDKGKSVNVAVKVLEQPVEQLMDKPSPEFIVTKNSVEVSNSHNKVTIPTLSRETEQTREQVFQQIMQKVHLLVRGEHAEMNLQLKPDNLGKLNMQVVVENGVITARFAAESIQVKELIEANLTNLKQTLTNQGLKVDQITVSVSQGGEQMAQWSRNRDFTPGKNSKGSANQVEDGYLEPLAVQDYGRGLGVGDSMVDYRV